MSYTLNTTIERESEREREVGVRVSECHHQEPNRLAMYSQSSFFSLVFISCSCPFDSLLNCASVLTNWQKLMDSRLYKYIQYTMSHTLCQAIHDNYTEDLLISEKSLNDPCSQWVNCQLRNERQILTTSMCVCVCLKC